MEHSETAVKCTQLFGNFPAFLGLNLLKSTLSFEIEISLWTTQLFLRNFHLYFPAYLKILAKGPQRS